MFETSGFSDNSYDSGFLNCTGVSYEDNCGYADAYCPGCGSRDCCHETDKLDAFLLDDPLEYDADYRWGESCGEGTINCDGYALTRDEADAYADLLKREGDLEGYDPNDAYDEE